MKRIDAMTRCDCCEREVAKVLQSIWHGDDKICSACFYVWHDGGGPDKKSIAAEVLEAERAGKFPFTMPNRADFERIS